MATNNLNALEDKSNADIFIKVFEEKDLFTGLYIQTSGNSTCIYEVVEKHGEFYLSPIYHIHNREIGVKTSKLIGSGFGLYKLSSVTSQPIETVYTQRLNRKHKFKEILNE